MSTADVSHEFETKHAGAAGAKTFSVALIGPDKGRRSTMRNALAETNRATVKEFDSYPPGHDHLVKLMASVDLIAIDLDSNPDVAVGLMEQAKAGEAGKVIVYSERADRELAGRAMHAGARECLQLPLEQGAMDGALTRIETTPREKTMSSGKPLGKLLVFVGSKGGSGVTTVACNVAIALAHQSDQRTLLVDLALPIGDVALSLGIAAHNSTDDALRGIDHLDARQLESLLVRHQSGVYVLAAPTKVPEVEVSEDAIDKLIAIARQDFDQVIVDVGSRIDVSAKALFAVASTIYLVTQTGISDLRNSNRLISQFFNEGNQNLEIVINRFESRSNETVNEDVITKALGRPVGWKIPDDQDAARALQHDAGPGGARISRISLEMASSITGRPMQDEFGGSGRGQGDSGNVETSEWDSIPDTARATATVTWPTPQLITYGDKLGNTQLNATASVQGSFVYTPGPGYVLPAGTHTLWVTFTPSNSDGAAPLQAAVSIVVVKATPEIHWATPAEIECGTALSDVQLNARAPIPGRFGYSPAHGEMLPPGPHKLSVTFTPSDGANYNSAMATTQLSVARARAAIHWPTPDPITYGTQLTPMQLCATASVQGAFEYNPGLGAVLAAGEHKLSAGFTPSDLSDYVGSHASVSLKVMKATPSIAWPSPEPVADGTNLSAKQLNATAPVPGAFAYTPASGEILQPGVHTLSLIFTPTDSLNYTTARATVSLTVTEKIPSQINWQAPVAIPYGTALSASQLNAKASVPGTFIYTPGAGHVLAPGKYVLSVSFTPSDTEKYAASKAEVELVVEPASENDPPTSDSRLPSQWNPVATDFAPPAPPRARTAPPPQVQRAPERAPERVPERAPERAPEVEASSTEATEPQFTWTFTAINSAANSASSVATGERTAANKAPLETRTYKGAVYEKGEDGKWHLQKK